MEDRSHSGINKYAVRLIGFKARQLCRRPGFPPSDRADIEQELWVDLLERLPQYDVSKAKLNTFISRIIDNKIASIIRYRMAEMRSPEREECSLNDQVRDGDGRLVDRHQTTREAANSWQCLHDLKSDVEELREILPSALHRLVMDAFLRGGTTNSVANELGITHTVVLCCEVEMFEIFNDGHLREYL